MWIGACTSTIGTFMQVVAQGWLIYNLSHSPFLLALDQVLQATPIFLFSLIGGVIADRVERRHLLMGSQWVQMGCATVLTFLVGFHAIKVWHMLACSCVTGFAQAFGGPAYQALIPNLVKKDDVPNAISLISIQFNMAVLVGPALGGLAFAKLGATWCFGLNALSFLAPVVALGMLTVRFLPVKTTESIMTSLKQGIQFVRVREGMAGLMVLAFLMTALAVPSRTFLPVFAKDIFHRGAETYALFLSASGAGSILGALTVAGLGNIRRTRARGARHDDLPGSVHRGVRPLAFHPAGVRHAVLLGGLHDLGLHHGQLAGAAHRDQRDARPGDERLQLLFPQRHAFGKPGVRLARPNPYGPSSGCGQWRAIGLPGAVFPDGAAASCRAVMETRA